MFEKIIEVLKANAASHRSDNPDYDGVFDDYLLVRATRDVYGRGGYLFVEGEYALVESPPDPATGKWDAYSFRYGVWYPSAPADCLELVDQDLKVPDKPYEVRLATQDTFRDASETKSDLWVSVADAREASAICLQYIEEKNLNDDDWNGGQVRLFVSKQHIADIAVNGSVWKANAHPSDKFEVVDFLEEAEEITEFQNGSTISSRLSI